ncbi:MAG TPA: TadE family protein [Methylotenera sp.]
MSTLNIKANSIPQRQRGAAAVEFALVIIPLLMIVAGIIEFGRTFWYYDALAKSTRDAARYVSNSRANPAPALAVDNAVKDDAKAMVLTAVNAANVPDFLIDYVDVTCDPVDCVTPSYVTVSIEDYPITIGSWIPIIIPTGAKTWSTTLTTATTMRYMK